MRIINGQNTVSIPRCIDSEQQVPEKVTLEREIDGMTFEAENVQAHYIPCQNTVVVSFSVGKMPTGRYKFVFEGKFKYTSLCWIQ